MDRFVCLESFTDIAQILGADGIARLYRVSVEGEESDGAEDGKDGDDDDELDEGETSSVIPAEAGIYRVSSRI